MKKDEVLAQLMKLEKKPLIYAGLGGCAKDLCSVLEEGEVVEGVINACDRNAGHLLKGGKAVRSYLVSTNARVLLIERGQMVASLIRALDKTISIPKSDIMHIKIEPVSGVNKVYYSSVLTIMTSREVYEFYITGNLEEYIPKGLRYTHTEVNKGGNEENLEKVADLSEEVSLFCRECGMKLDSAWKNCPKCGTPVTFINK